VEHAPDSSGAKGVLFRDNGISESYLPMLLSSGGGPLRARQAGAPQATFSH
jgi:hypothetical protein